MTTNLDSIDRRLASLVEIAHLQQQNIAALTDRTERILQGIDALREVTQQQAQTAASQAESIRSLVSAVAELARSTTELSRDRRTLLESAQRSAQASESASFMAQRTLEAVRDLIDELRNRP